MILVDADVSGEWDSSTDWSAHAERSVSAAIGHSRHADLASAEAEVSVKFTSDEEVRALNAAWRGKDKPTNVLSFPLAEADELDNPGEGPELMLGDIVLAKGVCEREAAEKAIPVERHATHLLVHGTLHLLGYDHMDDGQAADMEDREIRALARLGIDDPYRVID